MQRLLLVLLVSASTFLPGSVSAAEWKIDGTHSAVEFKVRHMMVSWVRGTFGKVSGTVQLDHSNLAASSVTVSIDAASVDTGNEKRDKHLRDSDFFDVEKHPTITFVSRSVRGVGTDSFEFVGDLTLLGNTQEVVMAVTDVASPVVSPWGGNKSGASASFEIQRSAFGMQYRKLLEAGGLVVGDDVKISIDVELNEVTAK
jgi:polyisoprenoid-binding protein YceI